MIRGFFFVFAVFQALFSMSQIFGDPVEFHLFQKSNAIPQDLANSRSVVVISSDERSDLWKKQSTQIHSQLKRMKVDPIIYIHYWDYKSSPVVEQRIQQMLASRQTKYLFLFHVGDQVRLSIIPLQNGKPVWNSNAWFVSDGDLNQVIFKLALEQKKIDQPSTNFLIADNPEFLSDITIFAGDQLPVYPSQVQRRQMAVVLLPLLEMEPVDNEARMAIEKYNKEIEAINQTIRSSFEDYPYPFEFLEYDTDENIAKKRFQYALRFVRSSGETVKRLLDYKIEETETDFVSIIPLADGQRTLKTHPIESAVYKVYIQQTIVFDCHVGRYWDADPSLERALDNFLLNMQNQFNKNQ